MNDLHLHFCFININKNEVEVDSRRNDLLFKGRVLTFLLPLLPFRLVLDVDDVLTQLAVESPERRRCNCRGACDEGELLLDELLTCLVVATTDDDGTPPPPPAVRGS